MKEVSLLLEVEEKREMMMNCRMGVLLE